MTALTTMQWGYPQTRAAAGGLGDEENQRSMTMTDPIADFDPSA